jgi:hypothetical protein
MIRSQFTEATPSLIAPKTHSTQGCKTPHMLICKACQYLKRDLPAKMTFSAAQPGVQPESVKKSNKTTKITRFPGAPGTVCASARKHRA